MTIPANFALHSGEKSAIIASFQKRRVSTSVVHRLPKPRRRVRFPYPAPNRRALGSKALRFYSSAAMVWEFLHLSYMIVRNS